MSAPSRTECFVELGDELVAGRSRRLVVAKRASRWFVLEGRASAPLSTYAVHGPVAGDNGEGNYPLAMERALEMHADAVEAVP